MNRRHFFQSSLAAAVACALPYGRLLAVDQAATQAAGGIAAVTGAGKATVIEQAAIKELRAALRGPLLLAGDPGYDLARRVLNESIDKHPALVVQPTGVADIRTAVTFARERGLLLAVKCGGHSPGGKSTCDGGMQIDLSRFRGARVDPVARVAYVDGGSLLGDMDHETMALGLVTTAGTVSHTGVGGLTLGGGFGRVARRFGLALDNVRAVDIVTADGALRHASADENGDLYWGVRGGGGNFGVVTGFEFRLHPMQRQIIGGNLIFPIARARELLAVYGEYSAAVPDDLYVDAALGAPMGQPGVFLFHVCYSGPAERAESLLAPLRKLGTPISDTIRAQDYDAIQRSSDRSDPRNEGTYLKSGFIGSYPDALVDAIADGFEPHPDRNTVLFFQHGGGAIGRVAADATAFPHRYATHNMLSVVSWKLDQDGRPHMDWLRRFWAGGPEAFTRGYYTVETTDEAQSVRDDNYQGNLARLRRIKAKYDPGNLFRLNANVQPA